MKRRLRDVEPDPDRNRCPQHHPDTGMRCIRVRSHEGNHASRRPQVVGEYDSWDRAEEHDPGT